MPLQSSPLPTAPLCAASAPSRETAVCGNHSDTPSVVHSIRAVSSASASVKACTLSASVRERVVGIVSVRFSSSNSTPSASPASRTW